MTDFETASSCIPAKSSKIQFDEDNVNLVKDKHPALILGFLGAGLVGDIAATELIEQLKMEQIGVVITEDLPAMAVFKNGILQHPFRLYYSGEKNILVGICEIPFNKSDTYSDLARLISGWALDIDIDEICVIQGLSEQGLPMEHPVYVAAEKEIIDRISEKSDTETLPKGLIMGPEAAVLNEGLNNRLNCYALLTPVNPSIPDPAAAAVCIEQLNKIYSLNIDTKKLHEESDEIKQKLKELSQKTEQQHRKMLSTSKASESGGMYL
ncbi:MAG: hypothetical protein GF364_04310 [Candidatus Lokiarchaeota archaeon]|nr:hypothetical protein [Candidatus Lokiarchaeota archaeon]